jgi:hypothetical protein
MDDGANDELVSEMDGSTQDATNDMETNLDQVHLSSLEKIPNQMRNGFLLLIFSKESKILSCIHIYTYIHTYIYNSYNSPKILLI